MRHWINVQRTGHTVGLSQQFSIHPEGVPCEGFGERLSLGLRTRGLRFVREFIIDEKKYHQVTRYSETI